MTQNSKQGLDWIVGVPRSGAVNFLTVALFFTTLCFLWFYFAQGHEFTRSNPALILKYFVQNYERLAESLYVSSQHVLFSLIVGSVVGFPIGLVLALWRPLEKALTAILGFILAYPKLAVMFVAIIWIGHVEMSIYVTNIWVVMLVHILAGFRATQVALIGSDAVSRDTASAAVIYHRSRRELLMQYIMPLAKPSWFLALMYSSAFLWPLLIFSEPSVSTSGPGLGTLAHNSVADGLDMEQLFAVSILLAFCNLLTWGGIRLIEILTTRH